MLVGFPYVDTAVSSTDATDGETAERILLNSFAEGGAAGNLKSIGGNCGLRAGMRDDSFGFMGLGPPDPVRWFLIGRSTSTRRLPGDGLIGDSGGCKPRTECRPTERLVSHVS